MRTAFFFFYSSYFHKASALTAQTVIEQLAFTADTQSSSVFLIGNLFVRGNYRNVLGYCCDEFLAVKLRKQTSAALYTFLVHLIIIETTEQRGRVKVSLLPERLTSRLPGITFSGESKSLQA